MAKQLSVIFNAIDNMSDKLGAMASSGRAVGSSFQGVENSVNASFSSIESGSDAISQSFERTTSSADSLASRLASSGSDAEDSFSVAASAADNAAEEMGELGDQAEGAEDGIDKLGKQARETEDEIERFGEQTEKTGEQSEKFGEKSAQALEGLNSLLVSGGIVAGLHKVAEGFAECADKAEVVETATAQLQTIAGGGSIGTLHEEIMDLSNDTGQAAEGLADTAYNAISAGTAVEESVEAASQANQLAVAGFTDTSSALSVLETAMNSYGEAAGGMEHVSDSLITVQNLGVTTVAQLAAQMGKAISTASAYNVSLENLESGYISVTKAGINTAEGTTYLSSMLNELGSSGSEISKLLKDETGSTFGELMNEGKSLADVLGMVYDACDNNAEAMMNMWGSAEAGKAANAIIGQGLDKFNDNLTTLQNETGTTAEAYAIMAGTTEYAHNKMDNAVKNTSVQIGEVLNPALTKVYGEIESMATGIGKFVEENPAVVKAIAAVTIGLGAMAAASAIATAAQMAFNAVAAAPFAVVVGGAAAIASGLLMLGEAYQEATDASNELTLKSQGQKQELDRLNDEYDEACNKYGVNSKQASELALEIGRLEEAYGEAGETIEQFHQRIEGLSESLSKISKTYSKSMKSANDLYGGSTMLIGQLQALQNQSSLTDAELSLMKKIVTELNGSYSELELTINEKTGKTNFSMDDLFDYAQAQAEQQKMEAANSALVAALGQYNETKSAYEQADSEVEGERNKYEDMKAAWIEDHPVLSQIGKGAEVSWSTDLGKQFDAWERAQDNYQASSDAYSELKEQIRDYCETLGYSAEEAERFIEKLDGTADAAERAAKKYGSTGDGLDTYEDRISSVVKSTKEKMETFVTAYNDAYSAAKESIEGQYALWDKVDKKVLNAKTSVSKIGEALDSQTSYWKNYSKNLENLQGRDVKDLDSVLKNMDDGSEKSAAALAGMAKASDRELEKIVKKYNRLHKVQDKTGSKIAELESEFASNMNDMAKDMNDAIEKMKMPEKAEAAAKKTIQAYVNAIRSGVGKAQSAADAVSAATTKALGKGGSSTPVVAGPAKKSSPQPSPTPTSGYASGTTDSDQVYIAGEDGPELIISGGGDTVFPTSETDRIISAVSGERGNPQITEPSAMRSSPPIKEDAAQDASGSGRTVTIRLEGSGSIQAGAGNSKEDIWNGMKGSIKSTFMQILREEVFEEGAGAYEF